MNSIYTIGHSTRSIEDFISLLKRQAITQLVDIRTIPKSRHNPQFGQTSLKNSLEAANIAYRYLPDLGGLRSGSKTSVNDGWRNSSFRNYADYMQTEEFQNGLDKLVELSQNETTVIMCAEAVPWRCHRSLVSDALMARRITVCEIISETSLREHTLTSFAIVKGRNITYPKTETTQ